MENELDTLRAQIEQLRDANAQLTDENHRLVSRNLALSEQLDAWHDTRMRVQLLKELMISDRRRMARADLKDDIELLALIEARVEKEKPHLQTGFNTEALAQMLGVTPLRLVRLFRHNTPHHTPEDYIDFRRVISAMEQMRQHPHYSIAAIAQDAGFASVRTFQRRMQQATGLTPVEYRLMFESKAP
ncbi:MAG: helix-turn-helix domain-containing protein [Prevotella sp.]|nr:helix-turn-helix domain-containing protein [Prevotella sp.]